MRSYLELSAEEHAWRQQGESAIRHEMERRLESWLAKKLAISTAKPLKSWRLEAKLTQDALNAKAGVRCVAQLECGERGSVIMWARLAAILGIQPSQIREFQQQHAELA